MEYLRRFFNFKGGGYVKKKDILLKVANEVYLRGGLVSLNRYC